MMPMLYFPRPFTQTTFNTINVLNCFWAYPPRRQFLDSESYFYEVDYVNQGASDVDAGDNNSLDLYRRIYKFFELEKLRAEARAVRITYNAPDDYTHEILSAENLPDPADFPPPPGIPDDPPFYWFIGQFITAINPPANSLAALIIQNNTPFFVWQ